MPFALFYEVRTAAEKALDEISLLISLLQVLQLELFKAFEEV